MLVENLIETLQNNPDAALNFVIEMPGLTQQIPAHLHITEIKQYAIESVDCGGKAHNWSETVIQIWAKNATDDGHRVTTSKALDIINKVDKVNALDKSNPVFIEYMNDDGLVSHYSIKALPGATMRAVVTLNLVGNNTQCKAPRHSLTATAADMTSPIHNNRCQSQSTSSCC